MSQRILIIEDEQAIADTLTYALKTEGYSVEHCLLGSLGLERMRLVSYSLAILDIGLPDISGFEVCRQARTFTNIPIIFLTARTEEVDRIVGLEIGGDDYVSKPFSPREVVTRVRVILRRLEAPVAPVTTTQDDLFKVDEASARIRYCGTPMDLTRYEFFLLKTLLEHPERIYTRAGLMNKIWHDALDTSDRTVDTHIKTLRTKLKAINSNLDPLVTHRGMGYSITVRELI